MKNKIGFNPVFAIIAFPIAIALMRDFNTQSCTFRKPALDTLYLVTFLVLLFLTFKKIKKSSKNNKTT